MGGENHWQAYQAAWALGRCSRTTCGLLRLSTAREPGGRRVGATQGTVWMTATPRAPARHGSGLTLGRNSTGKPCWRFAKTGPLRNGQSAGWRTSQDLLRDHPRADSADAFVCPLLAWMLAVMFLKEDHSKASRHLLERLGQRRRCSVDQGRREGACLQR